jgi:hypothetical protein
LKSRESATHQPRQELERIADRRIARRSSTAPLIGSPIAGQPNLGRAGAARHEAW